MPAFTWPKSPQDALKEQLTLRDLVSLKTSLPRSLKFGSGIAIGSAYDDATKTACATGRFFNDKGQCAKETLSATVERDFPYVPGLLAFRVGPAICAILDDIIDHVDLLMFDGQGIAHPRGFGLAAHIGVVYDKPAIGVTRNNLFGKIDATPTKSNERTPIKDPKSGVTLGFAVCLSDGHSACFVSPGNRCSAMDAMTLVLNISGGGSWFPKPLRRAHAAANKIAKTIDPSINENI